MWYCVNVIYESTIDGASIDDALFEESFIVFEADQNSDIDAIALKYAKDREHSYMNSNDETVSWNLVEIIKIYETCEDKLVSGCEVFSRHYRKTEM